jgi:electron transport complex protein RnfB
VNATAAADADALKQRVDALDALLPQTQCTRCGFPDCRAYAQAMAEGEVDINRCPPGGAEGIARLALLTGRQALPLDPGRGAESPRRLAVIDEDWCIGCTLCIQACPVDCIVGASRQMHTVIDELCTGCDLCLPVCPVDCISMVEVSGTLTGWDAWSAQQAQAARQRYAFHRLRTEREKRENDERLAAKAQAKLADLQGQSLITDPQLLERKRAVIEAAIARARAARES